MTLFVMVGPQWVGGRSYPVDGGGRPGMVLREGTDRSSLRAVPSPAPTGCLTGRRNAPRRGKEGIAYGDWDREVVQPREGLRLHHSRRRQRRCVRALQRHRRRGIQEPRRRTEGRVRGHAGPEGPAGREREARFLTGRVTPRTRGSNDVSSCAPRSVILASRGSPVAVSPFTKGDQV